MTSSSGKKVVFEQELLVDGITLKEKQEGTSEIIGENLTNTIKITKSIGQKVYQVAVVVQNDEVAAVGQNTKLTPSEIEEFEEEWDRKWKPELECESALDALSEGYAPAPLSNESNCSPGKEN